MARIRRRVAKYLNGRVEIGSRYQAGYDGFKLRYLFEAHGVGSYVIDAVSGQVDPRARMAACGASWRCSKNVHAGKVEADDWRI
jgi:hypothetical protein